MVQYVLYYEGLSEMGHDVNPDIEWSRISRDYLNQMRKQMSIKEICGNIHVAKKYFSSKTIS